MFARTHLSLVRPNMSDQEPLDSKQSVKKSTLYTRTGDSGTSQLFNGERREKSCDVFEALGSIDELSASLGLAREYCKADSNGLDPKLEWIQSRLIDLMSSVATPRDTTKSQSKLKRTEFDSTTVEQLEQWIDEMDSNLPPLTQFILPSGGLASAQLHVARGVARRAERCTVPLVMSESVEVQVGKFLNRLSGAPLLLVSIANASDRVRDFIFAAARTAAAFIGEKETTYKKAK